MTGSHDILLQHDDVLLPHWKEFTTALQLHHDSNIQFTIQNAQLTPSVTDLLMPSLKGKLKELFLDNNGFVNVSDGVTFAIKCMESNRQLKEFNYANNRLVRMKHVSLLLDAVIIHPSITKIRLENCLRGDIDGYIVLQFLFNSDKRFETIDLENNSIQTGGGTTVSDYIATNPPLRNLFFIKQ